MKFLQRMADGRLISRFIYEGGEDRADPFEELRAAERERELEEAREKEAARAKEATRAELERGQRVITQAQQNDTPAAAAARAKDGFRWEGEATGGLTAEDFSRKHAVAQRTRKDGTRLTAERAAVSVKARAEGRPDPTENEVGTAGPVPEMNHELTGPDGIALNSLVKDIVGGGGSRAERENLQVRLQAMGYYRGEIDGDIGRQSRMAVQRYLKDQGLYEGKIDGIVGKGTRAGLAQLRNEPLPGSALEISEASPRVKEILSHVLVGNRIEEYAKTTSMQNLTARERNELTQALIYEAEAKGEAGNIHLSKFVERLMAAGNPSILRRGPQSVKETVRRQLRTTNLKRISSALTRPDLAEKMEGGEDIWMVNLWDRVEGAGSTREVVEVTTRVGDEWVHMSPEAARSLTFQNLFYDEATGDYVGRIKNGCRENLVVIKTEDDPLEPVPVEETPPEVGFLRCVGSTGVYQAGEGVRYVDNDVRCDRNSPEGNGNDGPGETEGKDGADAPGTDAADAAGADAADGDGDGTGRS